jgi:hypothetical protein
VARVYLNHPQNRKQEKEKHDETSCSLCCGNAFLKFIIVVK